MREWMEIFYSNYQILIKNVQYLTKTSHYIRWARIDFRSELKIQSPSKEGILIRLHKWISIKGLGIALAVMMLLSCVVLVPEETQATTHNNVAALALGTTVPTAPLNLQADAGNQFVWLWWDHSANQGSDLIKNYTIYRNTTGSSTNFVKLDTVQIGPFNPVGTNRPYNDTTVQNDIAYYYQITADSDAGSSVPSNIATVTPVASATAPGAVQNLVATNGIYSAQLNWSSPASAGSTPIRAIWVYSPGFFGPVVTKLAANATSYKDTSALPGQSYNYTVRAISSTWGNTNSSIQKFIGGSGNVPGSPQNLTAFGGNNSVTVFWSDPVNPSSHGINNYTVLRSNAQSGSFTYIGNSSGFSILGTLISGPLPFFTDSTTINGQKYYYEVVSNNNFGSSAPSNIVNATPAYVAPTPDANAYPGNNKVLLVWSSPFNTTSVDIYRSTDGSLGNIVNTSTVKYPLRYFWYDNTTTNGNKYYYTVRANLTNVFLSSNQVNATPFAGSVPAAITNLIATPDHSNVGLYAKLAPSTDVLIGYHIYRGNTSGTEAAVPIMNGSFISTIDMSGINDFIASDDNVMDDVNHYYYVTTENLFGNSTHSNEAVSFASSTGDVPAPVTGLAAVGGSGQVTLTWDRPAYQGTANVLIYTVFRNYSNGWLSIQLFAYSGLGQQTYVDNTAIEGTTYQYYVMVSNIYGSSGSPSNIAQASATSSNVVPSAPVNLVATAGTGYVLLSWSAPTTVGPGIINYQIFRGTTAGGEGTTAWQTVSGSILAYNDTTVTAGQIYYYEVAAVNSIGTGTNSNEANGMAPVAAAPSAPVGLTAFASAGQIQLNWSAPSSIGTGITEYRVFKSATAGGEGTTPIITVSGSTLTFSDSNVMAGTPYYYQVKAVNAAGVGPGSNEASATGFSVEGVPTAPTGLAAVAGNGYILLNWTAPTVVGSGITGYKVYRGTSASGEGSTPIANPSGTTLTYNDSSVTAGVPYYYLVKASNANGTSDPSNEATATVVNPLVPSVPKNVVATPGAGQIVVTWDAPDSIGASPITGYQIFRSVNGSQLTSIGNTGADTRTFTDTNVDTSHIYGYAIVATNANGSSSASTPVTAIPNAAAGTSSTDNTMLYAGIGIIALILVILAAFLLMRGRKPVASAPIGLTAFAVVGKVQLKWSAPSKVGGGITEYRIYRGTNAGVATTKPIATVSGTTLMYEDMTVMAGTSYYYVVKGVNSAGEGAASNEVKVTTPKS